MHLVPNFCNLFPVAFFFEMYLFSCLIHKQNENRTPLRALFLRYCHPVELNRSYFFVVSQTVIWSMIAISCSWILYKSLEWINTLIDCKRRGNVRINSEICFLLLLLNEQSMTLTNSLWYAGQPWHNLKPFQEPETRLGETPPENFWVRRPTKLLFGIFRWISKTAGLSVWSRD